MKKMPTVFVRTFSNSGPGLATCVVHADCEWVFRREGVATRKWDGTSCLVKDGMLFKRRTVKPGKEPPPGFQQVDFDEVTGKAYGWVAVTGAPEDVRHNEAWRNNCADGPLPDGTYELIGPGVNGNPEKWSYCHLVRHGADELWIHPDELDYLGLKEFLRTHFIEGIVWHHPDGRMAKLKRRDFGLEWPVLNPHTTLW